MSEHRWSGWPGAFCLDCGVGDLAELSLADSCSDCVIEQDKEIIICSKHENGPCPKKSTL